VVENRNTVVEVVKIRGSVVFAARLWITLYLWVLIKAEERAISGEKKNLWAHTLQIRPLKPEDMMNSSVARATTRATMLSRMHGQRSYATSPNEAVAGRRATQGIRRKYYLHSMGRLSMYAAADSELVP
jgi:hypothetical protein